MRLGRTLSPGRRHAARGGRGDSCQFGFEAEAFTADSYIITIRTHVTECGASDLKAYVGGLLMDIRVDEAGLRPDSKPWYVSSRIRVRRRENGRRGAPRIETFHANPAKIMCAPTLWFWGFRIPIIVATVKGSPKPSCPKRRSNALVAYAAGTLAIVFGGEGDR